MKAQINYSLAGICFLVKLATASDEKLAGAVHELDDFTVVSTATRTERLIQEVPIKTE